MIVTIEIDNIESFFVNRSIMFSVIKDYTDLNIRQGEHLEGLFNVLKILDQIADSIDESENKFIQPPNDDYQQGSSESFAEQTQRRWREIRSNTPDELEQSSEQQD